MRIIYLDEYSFIFCFSSRDAMIFYSFSFLTYSSLLSYLVVSTHRPARKTSLHIKGTRTVESRNLRISYFSLIYSSL